MPKHTPTAARLRTLARQHRFRLRYGLRLTLDDVVTSREDWHARLDGALDEIDELGREGNEDTGGANHD